MEAPRTCQELRFFALRRATEAMAERQKALLCAVPTPIDQAWADALDDLSREAVGLGLIDSMMRKSDA